MQTKFACTCFSKIPNRLFHETSIYKVLAGTFLRFYFSFTTPQIDEQDRRTKK